MTVKIIPCSQSDIQILQDISVETYTETFQDYNTPENMSAYLENAYRLDKLKQEIAQDDSAFFFIYYNRYLAGYMKVNTGESQSEDLGDDMLEIERIYIRSRFQQKGLGRDLMNKAIEIAKVKKKQKIWLGVWEHNEQALAFYQKNGFIQTGSHSFFMGDDEQTDYIMVKTLRDDL